MANAREADEPHIRLSLAECDQPACGDPRAYPPYLHMVGNPVAKVVAWCRPEPGDLCAATRIARRLATPESADVSSLRPGKADLGQLNAVSAKNKDRKINYYGFWTEKVVHPDVVICPSSTFRFPGVKALARATIS